MLRNLLIITICILLLVNSACQNADTPNVNANTNVAKPTNLPPGFSNSPIPITGNSTPGIPDLNSNNANKPMTGTTPGIPDTSKRGTTSVPKGKTPIPGIPDEKTTPKLAKTPFRETNEINNPPALEIPNRNSNGKTNVNRKS